MPHPVIDNISDSAIELDDLPVATFGSGDDGDGPVGGPPSVSVTPQPTGPSIQATLPPAIQTISLGQTERIQHFYLEQKSLKPGQRRLAVHHIGKWWDWRYDEFEMTGKDLRKMISNFNSRALHKNAPKDRQVPLQAGHGFMDEPMALGWVTSLELEGNILYAVINTNDDGEIALKDGRFSYVSPRYDMNYQDQEIIGGVRKEHGPTLIHIALTNQPVLAELPNIALSRTPMPMDIGVFHAREAQMTQPQGDPAVQVQDPPAASPPAPPPAPPDNPTSPPEQQTTSLTSPAQAPAPQPPAPAAPAPSNGSVVLSREEWDRHQSQIRDLQASMERQQRQSHEREVEVLTQEAASRGVPPVVLDILRPVMLSCNPQAPTSFSLKIGETEKQVNTFQAMQELLQAMPTITLNQQTPENGGESPAAPRQMTPEEAEEEGRKMWKESGIVPALLRNE